MTNKHQVMLQPWLLSHQWITSDIWTYGMEGNDIISFLFHLAPLNTETCLLRKPWPAVPLWVNRADGTMEGAATCLPCSENGMPVWPSRGASGGDPEPARCPPLCCETLSVRGICDLCRPCLLKGPYVNWNPICLATGTLIEGVTVPACCKMALELTLAHRYFEPHAASLNYWLSTLLEKKWTCIERLGLLRKRRGMDEISRLCWEEENELCSWVMDQYWFSSALTALN